MQNNFLSQNNTKIKFLISWFTDRLVSIFTIFAFPNQPVWKNSRQKLDGLLMMLKMKNRKSKFKKYNSRGKPTFTFPSK